MPTTALAAAKRLCELSRWGLTNLQLQKILYIAQMMYLGRNGGQLPLVKETFEAWDYGPVVPELYHTAKVFGNNPVLNVFHGISDFLPAGEANLLQQVYEETSSITPAKLVSMTHWENGAWAKHYRPGAMGVEIPNKDIYQEYLDRLNVRK